MGVALKSHDVYVALGRLVDGSSASYALRAQRLGMSASELHAAERRLEAAGLLDSHSGSIVRGTFLKFLTCGVPYAFYCKQGEVTRGMPTAWAAPVLSGRFAESNQLPPVWPHAKGKVQGSAVTPLHKGIPDAIEGQPELYALLALVDALRIGRARDRKIAEQELISRLKSDGRD